MCKLCFKARKSRKKITMQVVRIFVKMDFHLFNHSNLFLLSRCNWCRPFQTFGGMGIWRYSKQTWKQEFQIQERLLPFIITHKQQADENLLYLCLKLTCLYFWFVRIVVAAVQSTMKLTKVLSADWLRPAWRLKTDAILASSKQEQRFRWITLKTLVSSASLSLCFETYVAEVQ